MSFEIKQNKEIIEVLNGTNKEIAANIELLAKAYLEKTGRKVCRTCPSDIQNMILILKNIYEMTQFKFKRLNAIYKDKKGDTTTISNGNMTDEKAVAFLKTNPERIKLFSEYPSNWAALVAGAKTETKKEKEARFAIEAELKASKLPKEKVLPKAPEVKKETVLKVKPVKALLMKMKLKELRAEFPDVKGASIKAIVEKIMKLPVEEVVQEVVQEIEKNVPKIEADIEADIEAAAIAEATKAAEEAAAKGNA